MVVSNWFVSENGLVKPFSPVFFLVLAPRRYISCCVLGLEDGVEYRYSGRRTSRARLSVRG